MGVDGVFSFQYAINEEKKENMVTEVYKDASVIGKFFAAVGDPAAAFKTITTTNTICCGPKAQVDQAGARWFGSQLSDKALPPKGVESNPPSPEK